MESVHFCTLCGRMLENSFLYCPYCGTPFQSDTGMNELVETSFRELEVKVQESTISKLDELTKVLVNLERDLDDFLSGG